MGIFSDEILQKNVSFSNLYKVNNYENPKYHNRKIVKT